MDKLLPDEFLRLVREKDDIKDDFDAKLKWVRLQMEENRGDLQALDRNRISGTTGKNW